MAAHQFFCRLGFAKHPKKLKKKYIHRTISLIIQSAQDVRATCLHCAFRTLHAHGRTPCGALRLQNRSQGPPRDLQGYAQGQGGVQEAERRRWRRRRAQRHGWRRRTQRHGRERPQLLPRPRQPRGPLCGALLNCGRGGGAADEGRAHHGGADAPPGGER